MVLLFQSGIVQQVQPLWLLSHLLYQEKTFNCECLDLRTLALALVVATVVVEYCRVVRTTAEEGSVNSAALAHLDG
jgi:hypothetical protein